MILRRKLPQEKNPPDPQPVGRALLFGPGRRLREDLRVLLHYLEPEAKSALIPKSVVHPSLPKVKFPGKLS